ncbi:MAG: lactate dehydrogenase [Rhodobacteraceae bacterium TMED111]|nr:lactate dehydrogenase [Marinovum sp.]OUV39253.1 MAG: lactate dehydrogenase [Rhodobacteraceae bacterium TMED111]
MPNINVKEILNVSKSALVQHGSDDWVAAHVAEAIAASESVGNRICGLYYLESYCEQLISGRVCGRASPEVHLVRPSSVYVDAKDGFAQPAFSKGLPEVLKAAQENGIASLSIGRAHTCTSLGFFTKKIAQAGFLGLGFTNASPIVAPPGGKSRIIGTNPIAFSVPDGNGGIAMQFDQSTTTVALGKITMAKAAGKSIPEGWALDKDGKPTTSPEEAIQGTLVSAGGYKGWGFGLMAEILVAGMTGGRISKNVAPLKAKEGEPHNLGQLYIVIDPNSGASFYNRLEELTAIISAEEGTRMPGQYTNPQSEVDVSDELWGLAISLSKAKPFE